MNVGSPWGWGVTSESRCGAAGRARAWGLGGASGVVCVQTTPAVFHPCSRPRNTAVPCGIVNSFVFDILK